MEKKVSNMNFLVKLNDAFKIGEIVGKKLLNLAGNKFKKK